MDTSALEYLNPRETFKDISRKHGWGVHCSTFILGGNEPKVTSMKNGQIPLLCFLSLAFLSQFCRQRVNICLMCPLPICILASLWLLYQSWPTAHPGPGPVDKCPPALLRWMSTEGPSTKGPEWSVTVSVWMVETQSALAGLHGKFGLTWSGQHGGMGVHGYCYLQPWV